MKPTPCNVCLGEPLKSGRQCICGGIGTEQAELQGLRERCFDLEARVEELETKLDNAEWQRRYA